MLPIGELQLEEEAANMHRHPAEEAAGGGGMQQEAAAHASGAWSSVWLPMLDCWEDLLFGCRGFFRTVSRARTDYVN